MITSFFFLRLKKSLFVYWVRMWRNKWKRYYASCCVAVTELLLCNCSFFSFREDVLPPKSRSSTARSYIGSNRSSLGSMSPSNMEGYSKTPYSQVPSEDFERTSGQNQTIASSKVAAPNLSRMGAVPVMIPAQSKDGSIVWNINLSPGFFKCLL